MESENKNHSSCRQWDSSVARKYVMGLTGVGLIVFIIMHLAGNLTLIDRSGKAFNHYAQNLHDFGWLAVAAEIGIALIIIVHVYMAFRLTWNYKKARPIGYSQLKSKGGPSKSTIGSRNMIVTGVVLLSFLILHIIQFRFGPALEQGYVVDINGRQARDLFRLVNETFLNPVYLAIYVGTMLFLCFHIRHGFWSMFQSLGLMFPKWDKPIYCTALVFAILMAAGFIFLPIYIYLGG